MQIITCISYCVQFTQKYETRKYRAASQAARCSYIPNHRILRVSDQSCTGRSIFLPVQYSSASAVSFSDIFTGFLPGRFPFYRFPSRSLSFLQVSFQVISGRSVRQNATVALMVSIYVWRVAWSASLYIPFHYRCKQNSSLPSFSVFFRALPALFPCSSRVLPALLPGLNVRLALMNIQLWTTALSSKEVAV